MCVTTFFCQKEDIWARLALGKTCTEAAGILVQQTTEQFGNLGSATTGEIGD